MQDRSQPTHLPATRPSDVPFVGWSRAAHEFRGQVAQLAPGGGVRPLIIGDPGVGKRTMARAWQVLAGDSRDNLIRNLDRLSIPLRRGCIGVTTFRPPQGRSALLLGRDARGEVPHASDQPGRGPELEDRVAGLFDLSLYMPPIAAGRQIDVLAFLDSWNRARSPFVGIRYARVSLRWLREIALVGPWPTNLDGVYGQLRMLNHLNRPTGEGDDHPEPIHEVDVLRERSEDPTKVPPAADEAGTILFGAIPDLAVRTYLWLCQNAPFDEASPAPGGMERDDSPPDCWPAADFAPDLTATGFGRLTEEQFARQHVLPGLAGPLATRPDRLAVVLERLRRGTTFGTTFRALQEGLAIDPAGVEGRLGRPTDQARTKWVAGPAARPVAPAAGVEADAPAGWSGNRFCIEDGTYHIIFLAPGGHIERARLPVGGNLGLSYYRHLIREPETAFSARHLIARARDRQAADRGKLADDQEFRGDHSPLLQETIDKEALRSYQERLADLQRDRLRAERQGDALELQEIDEERQAIQCELDKVFHQNKVKNINDEAKKLQDRVRRALEDARIKLSRSKMPGLAEYLAQQIPYKGGNWTYRPARTAPHWHT